MIKLLTWSPKRERDTSLERIARIEKARAYMDGVMYPYAHDPDCVAFKWKLSSCHPCDDICDLYARADLWGDG